MFGLLKRKNPYEQPARSVYAETLEHVCSPKFYKEYGVPDTFDGRFELLLLHVFAIIHAMLNGSMKNDAEEFNQALFDAMFADMDQTLREMGIGDMGMPKHMRRMMKAFNGRMHAYEQALERDDWGEALKKNLYGTLEDGDIEQKHVSSMKSYVTQALMNIKPEEILSGAVDFNGGKNE